MRVLSSSIVHGPGEPVEVVSYDKRRKYYLRTPEQRDHGRYTGEVAATGGQDWQRLDLTAALRDAVAEILAGDELAGEREDALAIVSAYEERLRAANKVYQDERTDEALRELTAAFEIPAALDVVWRQVLAVPVQTRFHRMVRQINEYPFIAGRAATMFLVGWDGVTDAAGEPVAFRRGLGGVPAEIADAVPSFDLPVLAARAQSLLMPPDVRLGNSESRPSGSSSRTSSAAKKARPPNGRSIPTGSLGTSDSSDLTTAGPPGSASIQ